MGRSRNNKNRGRNKNKNVFVPRFNDNQNVEVAGRYKGVVEINEKNYGFAREKDHEFSYEPSDPFLRPDEVKKHNLRPGLEIEGEYEEEVPSGALEGMDSPVHGVRSDHRQAQHADGDPGHEVAQDEFGKSPPHLHLFHFLVRAFLHVPEPEHG